MTASVKPRVFLADDVRLYVYRSSFNPTYGPDAISCATGVSAQDPETPKKGAPVGTLRTYVTVRPLMLKDVPAALQLVGRAKFSIWFCTYTAPVWIPAS